MIGAGTIPVPRDRKEAVVSLTDRVAKPEVQSQHLKPPSVAEESARWLADNVFEPPMVRAVNRAALASLDSAMLFWIHFWIPATKSSGPV
ncbi:hypothetical protein HY970_03795 [Candidatus Kaiserbacteria bacterium]|nr:hypothetical protein [Candidatus Kaiserbacteria bacterium]